VNKPRVLADGNLSQVWGMAFLQILNHPKSDPMTDLTVSFNVYSENELSFANEIPEIRRELDALLVKHGCHTVGTVANTIFPTSLVNWNNIDATNLYKRYSEIWSRLSNVKANKKGTYFQRMIAFGWEEDDKSEQNSLLEGRRSNQLQHVIDAYNSKVKRRSAFIVSIFNPHVDHSFQPRQGFPCLQNIHFMPEGNDLIVTGVYATQLCVEKAYGNYLGLLNLGKFMANEMGLTLRQVRCKSSRINLTNKLTNTDIEHLRSVVSRLV